MKKRISLLVAIVLVAVLAISLSACNLLDGLVDKALKKAEEIATDWVEEFIAERTVERTEVEAQTGDVVLEEGDLSFHFLTLGNNKTGDSTYIKIGDVDILIDAGSRQNSAETIINYVNGYCTDGKLEYVIATHAHQDHIAGFVGLKSKEGTYEEGVFSAFEIGTIIEFARTNAQPKEGSLYANYCAQRDAAVARGAKAYTALQCWNNQNGAQRTYTLAEGVTMDVLYNNYYENDTSNENNYSVCVMFTAGDDHYLFTGDLEAGGEKKLVENNNLPHCKLFKGGHHGSETANSAELMAAIQPDVVCVCCCCGSTEYSSDDAKVFPSQKFFNNVLPYTDQIFVTTIIVEGDATVEDDDDDDADFTDMNGNIVVVVRGGEMTVTCSASAVAAPYTEWFAAHRTWPEGVREKYGTQ